MTKRMKLKTKLKSRQQGAVAIIVALSLFALIGMLGLVLDLGHIYVTKTELQNAADAAALSGAERLDGTLCRVNSDLAGCDKTNKGAVQLAIETASKNKYDFNKIPEKGIDIDIKDIYLGSCPDRDRPGEADTDDCVMVRADSVDQVAEAAGMTFLRVDTRNRILDTWFAKIWNILHMQTYAIAVAGRYVTQVSPIAVCAIDSVNETQYVSEDGNFPKFIAEWGFRRGTSYEMASVNTNSGVPSGIQPGDSLYVHPTAKTEAECKKDSLPETAMVPFLCGGKSTLEGSRGSYVYANTGNMTGKSVDALNTRFGVSSSSCETNPDSNTDLYTPTYAKANWMDYTKDDRDPTQTAITDLAKRLANPKNDTPQYTKPGKKNPSLQGILEKNEAQDGVSGGCSNDCGDNYGVLWSNYRPLKKMTADTNTPVNALTSDWPAIYRGGPTYKGASWAPRYTNGNGRRIINVLIVDCSAAAGSGACGAIPVLGLGEFFLQTKVGTGSGTNIYGEFGRIIPQPLASKAQIRLYR